MVRWYWSGGVGVDGQKDSERVRKARDAETAHLDAVIKVNGAAYLRLSAIADMLRRDQALADSSMELKATPGEIPALWLDSAHAITMEPDARTFRLTQHGVNTKSVLLETQDQATMKRHALTVVAHQSVLGVRQSAAQQRVWRTSVYVYVWLTGLITGGAVVALYFIYLKGLRF